MNDFQEHDDKAIILSQAVNGTWSARRLKGGPKIKGPSSVEAHLNLLEAEAKDGLKS